jgi:hypothetical protein
MPYSYFVAELQCPGCGTSTESTVMTKVESDPGTVIRAGDSLDVTVIDMKYSHYTLRAPQPGEPLRILESWSCPACGRPGWIEIVVDDGRVQSIDVVPFDTATLDRVHFVADQLAEFYEEKAGEPLYVGNEVRRDWMERLRQHLARPGTP